MTQQEQRIMEMLINANQAKTKTILNTFLKKYYKKTIITKDYTIAEGTIPIALVAHLDTVFEDSIAKYGRDLFYDENRNVMFSPYGGGFDDKAGVFAIIQLIRRGLRPHVILTTDEEIGVLGALKVAGLTCPFSELKYIIELDRRGSNDCVFYDCINQDFIDYVESFGFSFNHGSFSDISELCPAWRVAGVNLSVGYYNEHSESEILYVGQLMATIEKVHKMLSTAEEAPSFIYIPSPNSFGKNWYFTKTPFANELEDNQVLKCEKCKKYFMEEELFPTVNLKKGTSFFCPDCMVNHIGWCSKCGNAYELNPNTADAGLCPFCKEEGEVKSDS